MQDLSSPIRVGAYAPATEVQSPPIRDGTYAPATEVQSPPIRDGAYAPAMEVQSLNPWTTREVPDLAS